MAVETPAGEVGAIAPDFALPDTDGKAWTLDAVRGDRGTVIVFICNHCPYVKAVIDRFVADAKALQDIGVGVAAIMPNDWTTHPDDAPDRMAEFAQRHGFTFPYLVDESQQTAQAYGAVCTPDIFGFDRDLKLRYRGRIDSAGRQAADSGTRRELLEAMRAIAETGEGPAQQWSSMGCSIKWRAHTQ